MEQEKEQEQVHEDVKFKKRNWVKRSIYIGLSVLLAVVVFFAGFLTRHWTLDKELQVLLEVKNGIQNSYYQPVTDEQFYDVLFDAINGDLLDRYSKYMDADEVKETRAHGKGKYEGIGLSFNGTVEGAESLKIVRVSSNSPAEEAGICAGEYVVAVGDDMESAETVQSYQQFKDRITEYEKDELFILWTASTPDSVIRTAYTVSRKEYTENYVFYRTSTGAYRFTGTSDATPSAYDNALDVLPEDTAYIRLTQFNGNADKAFDSAMNIFKNENKKNLVLDLRGNGGGYMYIMQNIAKYFCKTAEGKNPVVAYAQYAQSREKYVAPNNVYAEYFDAESKIYVLADSSSASASECLLGVMLDYGAVEYADICLSERNGTAKTFGKGIMQVTFPLSIVRGDALKLTTAHVLWPSGNCIHDRGVLPADGTKTVAENKEGDKELVNALQKLGAI